MRHASRPTLLIFTLGPQGEGLRRKLLPGKLGRLEHRLHRACLDAALAAGRETGCRVEVSSPHRFELPAGVGRVGQPGRDFGSRLVGAVRRAHREGGPLVLVGSDVPGLGSEHVNRALGELEENSRRVVLGPSPDGGLYLLASSRPIDHLLEKVSWCRPDTLTSLRSQLAAAGFEVVLLEPLADLDRPADLDRWLAQPSRLASRGWKALLVRLRRLLALWRAPTLPRQLGRPLPVRVPVRTGRAPPRSLRR